MRPLLSLLPPPSRSDGRRPGKAAHLLATIAESMQPAADEFAVRLVEQLRDEVPELAGDPALGRLLLASVAENVESVLRVFESPYDRGPIALPPAALEHTTRLAQRGIPVSALLRAYRLGQANFHQAFMAHVAQAHESTEVLADAAMEFSAVAFEYVDQVSQAVITTYERETDEWLRSRVAARYARVRRVLSDTPPDLADVERALGYRFAGRHVGVVLWADAAAPGRDRLTSLERIAKRLADRVGTQRPLLLVAPDEATMWAWLPAPTTPVVDVMQEFAAELDEAAWVSVGEPAAGLPGFRLTHRQARQAQVVAMAAESSTPARVTLSSDVGPVGLMCADLEATAAWVHATLGDLALDDEPHARLRETLWTFLSAGRSFTAAAQKLIMHKNTVQYRIRKAEEARGRPIHDRRLDLELALSVCRALGSTVLVTPEEP